MIVKNEESVLKRCLDCAKKFSDEIIIVDTGSTDKTKQIAKEYTDKIYDFKWVDDFSLARNYSLKFATCDYIMWLDADDYITEENIEKIIKLKNEKSLANVYMLKYEIAFNSEDKPTFSYYRERIFKNRAGFYFQGFIHEAVAPRGKIEYLDISIRQKRKQIVDKKRNLNIYLSQIKRGKELSPRDRFYFAREYFYNSKYRCALREFKKYLQSSNKFYPNEIDANIFIAKAYLSLKKNNLAKAWLFKALQTIDLGAEGCCLLGEISLQENNLSLASFWYRSALCQNNDEKDGRFVDNSYFTIIPSLQLTFIYYKLGEFEKAQYYHEKSKTYDKNNRSVLYNEQFFKSKKIWNIISLCYNTNKVKIYETY